MVRLLLASADATHRFAGQGPFARGTSLAFSSPLEMDLYMIAAGIRRMLGGLQFTAEPLNSPRASGTFRDGRNDFAFQHSSDRMHRYQQQRTLGSMLSPTCRW